MNTKTMHEQISAFADGEADEGEIEATLAALRSPEGRAAWEDYHQIGDVLRSEDMALSMSADFAAKLMRRIDDEPAIVAAPRRQSAEQREPVAEVCSSSRSGAKHFMLSGLAAAVMAVLTAVVAQQWLGGDKGREEASAPVMASNTPASAGAVIPAAVSNEAGAQQERNLMRNPGIDEYLLAHQRFSPSLYSTAQYARSATFAVDSDK
jgi:sigma-E factor negative regulatory protein RseA